MSAKRAILITGCSSGIGLAAAKALRERGYQVIASCRKSEDVERLEQDGFEHVLQLDLASSESIETAVDQTLKLCDAKLFAVFNNGAFGVPGAVEDLSRDALRRQFETNVFGTHELTRLLIPTFLQQDDARIIQNSSVLGFIGAPFRGAYCASKFALEGLTDTMRLELAGTPVKCSLIEPGPILTRFRANALKAFQAEIDIEGSRHSAQYQEVLARLSKEGPGMKFTLPAEACNKLVIHALESPRPRARYRITTPTHVMHVLKRVLSTRLLDAFLLKYGGA